MPKTNQKIANEDAPHYEGHRARLRQRFLDAGSEGLSDHEVLELILFQTIPRRDVKPIAKELIRRFSDFPGVINAPLEELLTNEGISENSAIALKTIQMAARRLARQQIMNQPVISSWQQLLDYCYATMGSEKVEQFRLLLLDRKNRLIADELQQQGTVDHTPAYPREIIKRALNMGATALILVHNHPSGDPTPSKSDIELTKHIAQAAALLDIHLHDHVIIARGQHYSFKTNGLL
jgi:DNA repair protein RadC